MQPVKFGTARPEQLLLFEFFMSRISFYFHISQFDNQVQPACLPNPLNDDDDGGEINGTLKFVVSGYGMTEDGSYSSQLRSASVKVVSTQQCKQDMNRDPRSSMVIAPTNWCARAIQGSLDCVGDSGGPVIRKLHGINVLVGIISWGRGCRDPDVPSYSVYTKVRCYLPWIHESLNQPFSECGPS